MIHGEPQTLIVFSEDELYVDQLKKLVETSNDTGEERPVGTKDGSIKIVFWDGESWKDKKKKRNNGDKALFIGGVAGIHKLISRLDVKYDKYGIKYGWTGNQALVIANPRALSKSEEYNKFVEKLNAVVVPNSIKAEYKIIKEERPVFSNASRKAGKVKKVFSDANSNKIRRQQYFYGILMLYLNHLEEFMNKNDEFVEGWRFAAHNNDVGSTMVSSETGASYVNEVNVAIEKFEKDLLANKTNASDASVGGYAAETWHAGTYNINATAANSKNRAIAGQPGTEGELGRNNYGSPDIRVQTRDGTVINDYGLKYMASAKDTAREQARPNPKTDAPKYTRQKRLGPSDQTDLSVDYAKRRASNEKTPENWKKGYEEVAKNTTDTITDGKIKSKPLSKQEDLELAKEIKDGKVDLEKHGVTANNSITGEYVMKQAAKAGFSAGAMTAAVQTAPELYTFFEHLIKNKQIDLKQLKKTGKVAITSTGEGFLKGSIAAALQIECAKGAFGEAFKKIDPTFLGAFTSIVIDTAKNGIRVAAGKMTQREMGEALIDNVVISTGYVAGMKIGESIGKAFGFTLPLMGHMMGSAIGFSFSALYRIGKKKLLSFCADSGFTFFGIAKKKKKST